MQLQSSNTFVPKLNKPALSGAKVLINSQSRSNLTAMIHLTQAWQERSRQRRALALLNTYQLNDIGISAEDAINEANKPFWMP